MGSNGTIERTQERDGGDGRGAGDRCDDCGEPLVWVSDGGDAAVLECRNCE